MIFVFWIYEGILWSLFGYFISGIVMTLCVCTLLVFVHVVFLYVDTGCYDDIYEVTLAFPPLARCDRLVIRAMVIEN